MCNRICSVTWALVVTVAVAQLLLYYRLRDNKTEYAYMSSDLLEDLPQTNGSDCPVQCTCTMYRMSCSQVEFENVPQGRWPIIKEVLLNKNSITSIPKNLSQRLPQLNELNMMQNRLGMLDLGVFVGFVGYWDGSTELLLVLSSNEIAIIVPPPEGTQVETLTFLDLSDNKLTSLDSEVFLAVPNLKMIWFTNNPLKIPEDRPFLVSSSLRIISLDKTDASLMNEKTFTKLPSLTDVALVDAKVHTITNIFTTLQSLMFLHLKNNDITEVKANSFALNRKLYLLDLTGNPLHDLDPAQLPVDPGGTLFIVDTPFACSCAHTKIISWAKKRDIVLEDHCKDTPCVVTEDAQNEVITK